MRIGIPQESRSGETRVAGTPRTVSSLVGLGYEVTVESGAGLAAHADDDAYREAGAEIGDPWPADVVIKLGPPTDEEISRLTDGATLIAQVSPGLEPELVEKLAARPITVLATDAVPRISRAQSLDTLSSMANLAGYRAVIEAASHLGRSLAGQITAAGKVPPAKVLVAGAGVAGLAAIGTASSMGAMVRATDPRPEVAEQVGSLGGEFLAVEVADEDQEVSSDGYARATSEAYDARAAEIYSEQAAEVDVVITTALIPGQEAPRLITEADVASMNPGSVVVDMAAAQGGNVAGSVVDDVVVTDNGVTIIGYTDLAGRLPAQASQLYGTNMVNLMKLLTPEKDGELVLDTEDEVQRGMTVVHQGENMWPPPPVSVSAAPSDDQQAAAEPAPEPKGPMSRGKRFGLIGVGIAALFALTATAPSQLITNITVFVLAVVIGFYVIGQVHHALHTPLLSVTNAISGIIVVGALLQVGQHGVAVTVLALLAVLVASINIFGGFYVTRRMLGMFSTDPEASR